MTATEIQNNMTEIWDGIDAFFMVIEKLLSATLIRNDLEISWKRCPKMSRYLFFVYVFGKKIIGIEMIGQLLDEVNNF